MQYAMDIRAHNVPLHLDVEKDMQAKKNGLFTFTIRINSGNVVDYNVIENVDVISKYFSLKSVSVQELSISHTTGE